MLCWIFSHYVCVTLLFCAFPCAMGGWLLWAISLGSLVLWLLAGFNWHTQANGWEGENVGKVLSPLCPVTEGWLCPCIKNHSQQPPPRATDSSPCPSRPRGGNCSVPPSVFFDSTLPTPLWTFPLLHSSQSPDSSGSPIPYWALTDSMHSILSTTSWGRYPLVGEETMT